MFSIDEVVPGAAPPVQIVDVGAMSLGEGTEVYTRLLRRGAARVVGFEPLREECERLNRLHGDSHRFLPLCVGDGSARTFYITNTGMTSSLYEPNTELLSRFDGLEEYLRVVRTEQVQTYRLDDIEALRGGVDYLKVDVQGAELDVLQHATRVLEDAVIVHTEVEFVPLYRDQPLFAEVDALLRSRGFMFHRLIDLSGRPYRPLLRNNNPLEPISQHLWGDALYVRELSRLAQTPPHKLRALAAVLHEVYQSVDLCHVVLVEYDRQTGEQTAPRYLRRLTGAS